MMASAERAAILLRSAEGVLKDLLLKIGVTDAAHVHDRDSYTRSRKLLKMALRELRKLDEDLGAFTTPEPAGRGEVAPSQEAAMSMEGPRLSDSQERAVNILAHQMGAYVPPELR
jgi:esterase/lipase superfamily enzyme